MKKYSQRFATTESVQEYECQEYSPNGYAAKIWNLQKPFLGEIFTHFKRQHDHIRLLDFACGTGRVLTYFEKFCNSSDGLDISETMVEKARERCHLSSFCVANICADEVLHDKHYDVITSFRFLLNAEPELRFEVLKQLRKRMNEEHGILIVNVHGNCCSTRHFSILLRRLRAKFNPAAHEHIMMAEMGLEETRSLLGNARFKVVQELGFGIVPSFLYKTFLHPLCYWVDSKFCGSGWMSRFSVDVIFVCEPE